MKRIILAVLGLLVWTQCSDDEQTALQYRDSYRFYVYANLNGQPLNLNAGEDDYALFTQLKQDSLGVWHTIGTLARDSNRYRHAFQLRFRSNRAAATADEAGFSASFAVGPRTLADASGAVRIPGIYRFFFRPDSFSGHQNLLWEYEGRTYYGDSLRVDSFDAGTNPYCEIAMRSAGVFACTPLIVHRIEAHSNCRALLNVHASYDRLSAGVEPVLGRIEAIQWYLDSIPISESGNWQRNLSGSGQPHLVEAEVSFSGGCTERLAKLVVPGPANCERHLIYQKQPFRKPNPNNLGTVELVYFDGQGKRFSSFYAQNEGSFQIEKLKLLEAKNTLGPGLHNHLIFSGQALLKSADGQSIMLHNIHGSFATLLP